MQMTDLAQVILGGVALGSIYTLMGKGLLVTYLTTRALNFGQGDFLMIGSFMAMALMLAGVPVYLMVPIVLIAMAGLGYALERVAIRPLERLPAGAASALAWILTTMGFGMLLQNTAQLVWGKSRYYSPQLFAGEKGEVMSLWGVRFYMEELLVAAIALSVVAVLYWMLFRTRWGKHVAVVSFDKGTAQLLGINVRRVVVSSYLMMAGLAGISGILAGPLTSVNSHMGIMFLLKGFAAVCIGGFSNPLGVLIAGLGFGIVEALSGFLDSSYGDVYPFLIAFVILIVRPTGLFGESHTQVR
ncbi:MAG: branched-chain amino acid ABC transporter permease [Proteobacteria bacterium]|jgi:branched-chain amino acid transport system permease protein|nr:branched-chain amino acid ABC transporter permease [Pseudomonadota bacterium]